MIEEVSLGGFGFRTAVDHDLTVGDRLRITLADSSRLPHQHTVKVQYIVGPRIGIKNVA